VQIKQREGTTRMKFMKVHKVLHCKTSDGKRPKGCRETTVNRDVNASKNILELLQLEIGGQERPTVFSRSKTTKIVANQQILFSNGGHASGCGVSQKAQSDIHDTNIYTFDQSSSMAG
jgi:hypothetical protein